eukprot:CAMPEP_0170525810 /NCGR_PEP_ID=MMETSP0209-20121228/11256_1 /TAXON_ID=665100 ORGANISM="Litonotus pictus, Strain P1" /NCGR_SAMPLE_ID=MMETSP0209 /ASSEMBLY_ACC=CAM_ASM_000301 /LENGTH=119 /DNA_ID=CAMNT_0010815267 /DNA_START=361 /DNA_END=717 /DNA_ORIENTATION=+
MFVGRMLNHLDKAKKQIEIDSMLLKKREDLTNQAYIHSVEEMERENKIKLSKLEEVNTKLEEQTQSLEREIDQKEEELKNEIKYLKEKYYDGCLITKTKPEITWKPFKHTENTLSKLKE